MTVPFAGHDESSEHQPQITVTISHFETAPGLRLIKVGRKCDDKNRMNAFVARQVIL